MTLIAWYDTETDGLLNEATKMHCIAIKFSDGRKISAADKPGYEHGKEGRGWERMSVAEALQELEKADIRIAQNGQDFDERVIRKLFPWFNPKAGSWIIDTLIWSRLLYSDIRKFGPNNHKLFPKDKGSHSLDAWGKRLGNLKGDFHPKSWDLWCEDMQIYMEQDVEVLVDLYKWLKAQDPDPRASALEHSFAAIIRRQESRGVGFDMDKALTLLAKIQATEAKLEGELIGCFGQWWEYGVKANNRAGRYDFQDPTEDLEEEELTDREIAQLKARWMESLSWGNVIVPSKTRATKLVGFPDVEIKRFSEKTGKELAAYVGPPKLTYEEGCAYTPIKRVEFNPSSRDHIRKVLVEKFQWEPSKYTKNKCKPLPVVDDDVLRSLPYPQAWRLADYYTVLKRIGQISAGRKSWLKTAKSYTFINGLQYWRIHGRMNTNGAATGRATHSDPNLAQVPKNTAATQEMPDNPEVWGSACRDLFIAIAPYLMAGFDGSSLELCMLAHYVHVFDGGEYMRIVSEGDSDLGTDAHSWLRDLIGTELLGEGSRGRDHAKTTMYAYLYGAGDEKLGSIVLPLGTRAQKIAMGKQIKARLEGRFWALAKLKEAIERVVSEKGYLTGLDGRKLRIRKAHAALNTLLQSAGAVVMKKALVLLDKMLQDDGFVVGTDYEFVLNVHDEAQAEVLQAKIDRYKELATIAVPLAGQALGLKCPLKAKAVSGSSWMHTH